MTQRKNWQWLESNPRALEVVDQLGVLSDHALADLLATQGGVATNAQVSGWRRSRGIEPSRVRRDLRREYTEAEIRHILEAAVRPGNGLGSALAAVGRSVGSVTLMIERDRTPVAPASFK